MTEWSDVPLSNPTPPPGEQPLAARLPVPPIAFLGGHRYHLERVELHNLDAWRQQYGVELARVAWCGPLGWVSVYEFAS